MTKFIGRLATLGVAKEAVRGVPVAPTYSIPFETLSFDDKVVKVRETAGLGSIADADSAYVTTQYAEGDMTAEIRDKSFGLMLLNLLGTVSVAGPTDSTYTHSFSLAETNTHQSLCLLINDANVKEMYPLSMIKSLEINISLDNIVKYTVSFMSKRGDVSTAAVVALTSENKFTKKHLAFKLATNIAGIAAATAISLKSLTLKFENNVVMDDVLGTAEPEDIMNKQFSIEGTVELNYTDDTYKNYMRNGDYKAMEIKLVNTDVYAAGTTRPSLTMQFPRVDFFEWAPDYSIDDIVRQKFSFKCNRDVANSLAPISTCQLVNAVTSY
jgi:hypothetical protein